LGALIAVLDARVLALFLCASRMDKLGVGLSRALCDVRTALDTLLEV